MSNMTRVHESNIDQIDQKNFDVIGTVGIGEANYLPKEREVKADKRLPPFVGPNHAGTVRTLKVLLVESENPDDPVTIQNIKDSFCVYQAQLRRT